MAKLANIHLRSDLRFSTAVLAISMLSIAAFAQPATAPSEQPVKVLAPHKPIAPKVDKLFPLNAAVPGSMRGGPWFVDANFKSAVYIKNGVETSSVAITPVLYLSNGKSYTLPDVNLEPAGTAILDIGQSLERLGIAPYATLSGYVELMYKWPWDPICATIRNLDTTHSYDLQLRTAVEQAISIAERR